jgi:hypothetical protein
MGFDFERFERAAFRPREETLTFPALKDFFAEGEAPEFVVRGLSAAELSRAEEAKQRSKTLSVLMEVISQPGNKGDQVKELRKALGLSDDDVPTEMKKRLEMLVMGSVSPKMGMPVAVKLAENFPVEFMQLTHAITRLTGMGSEIEGKSKPSGETVTSEA